MLENGEKDLKKVSDTIISLIEKEPMAKIDYVKTVDADTIIPKEKASGRTLVAAAVYIGKTRLIDNFIYEEA